MTTSSPRFAVHAHQHSHPLQLGCFPLPVSQKGRLSARLIRGLGAVVLCLALLLHPWPALAASQIDIAGPPGSGQFGRTVTALPNGNIVVTDPGYDNGALLDVGAAYLYDGATGVLISKLTGSNPADQVGVHGVTVLSNGNYIVRSPLWHKQMGAMTWASATTGISGVVSASNSLVGGTPGDLLGDYRVVVLGNGNYLILTPHWHDGIAEIGAVTWGNGITGSSGVVNSQNSLVGSKMGDLLYVTVLSNGNYVVTNSAWSNGAKQNVGAVTWGNGMTGITGVVSTTNSLVGNTANDAVGDYGVTALSNGNYVVHSLLWSKGVAQYAGAVTWGDGTKGTTGVVSTTNSLVGSKTNDVVGSGGIVALSNGNYVVVSDHWSNGVAQNVGAVTWVSGATSVSGVVSSTNSLVGSTTDDAVGDGGVMALTNGNYVVRSPGWHNGVAERAGAVTWGNGTTGITGTVSSSNSLVGSTAGDGVGSRLTVLSNGNYVVSSPGWQNGVVPAAGAVTWGNGAIGTSGIVSSTNSLVGGTEGDLIGETSVTALSNGNYVVSSYFWHNGTVAEAGAVTWGNGATGSRGLVSVSNSLVGSTAKDRIGSPDYGIGVLALSNGNYVVSSPHWHNGTTLDAGAVTWGNGATGISGVVNASNSLVGSTAGDRVGSSFLTPLSNGNYVVSSPYWSNGAAVNTGAVTWGDGQHGISGLVSSSNSLIGSTAGDRVGSGDISDIIDFQTSSPGATALGNGNYIVRSSLWNNGANVNTGAVIWGSGTTGVSGFIDSNKGILGVAANGGASLNWAYDEVHQQVIVGRPADNTVTLFRFLPSTNFSQGFLPVVKK